MADQESFNIKSCPYCLNVLNSNKKRRQHVITEHPLEYSMFWLYECRICGNKYETLSEFNSHKAMDHEKIGKLKISSEVNKEPFSLELNYFGDITSKF